jgi:hypothetical protein
VKGGKACGLDNINKEMLKHDNEKLICAIKKFFNLVLLLSKFPEDWSRGIISTIFKSGDASICDNYMGLTGSSCLGKRVGTILNKRLQKNCYGKQTYP